jgi:hypothetical protein
MKRVAPYVAAVAPLMLLTPAFADPPKAACPVVSDPAGDVSQTNAPAGDASGDLLAVDIGTVGHKVTTSVSLAALDVAPPVAGHRYDVYLFDGERAVGLEATVDSGRAYYEVVEYAAGVPGGNGAFAGHSIGQITGSFDAAKRRVSMTADLAQLGFAQRRRVVVSARSWRTVGTSNTEPLRGYGFVASEDDTEESAPYRLGTRACRPNA